MTTAELLTTIGKEYYKINVIPFDQPIGRFYLGVLSAKQLLEIHIIRRQSEDPLFGIQRDVTSRANEIANYLITNPDATFPTSIIVAIDEMALNDCNEMVADDDNSDEKIEALRARKIDVNDYLKAVIETDFKNKPNYILVFHDDPSNLDQNDLNTPIDMYLKKTSKYASVIDGQHRIQGIKGANLTATELDDFRLPVVFSLDTTLNQQAIMFSIINGKQRQVPLSFVYNLFGKIDQRSEGKIAHSIAANLNSAPNGPWHGRIMMLGKKTINSRNESISQGTLAKEIEKLLKSSIFLSELFAKKEDGRILNIFEKYFEIIKKIWPDQWDSNTVLTKSVGVTGFLRGARVIVDCAYLTDNSNVQFYSDVIRKTKEIMDSRRLIFDNSLSSGIGVSKIVDCIKTALLVTLAEKVIPVPGKMEKLLKSQITELAALAVQAPQ
jgi:DGQHR domain-containing protein